MKLFQRIVNFFLVILVILGIAAVCFMFFFEQIKASLIAQGVEKINEQLVAKVDVNPKIELSLFEDFPQATLIFQDVKIYEPSETPNPDILASAKKLTLGFNILNVVLHKKYTLEKVALYMATVSPGIKSNGEPNYLIFKTPEVKSNTAPLDLDMKKIALTEVTCSYFNKTTHHNYEFDILKSTASFQLHNNEYKISLSGDVNVEGITLDQTTYFKDRSIRLDGAMTFLQNESLLLLDKTSIALNGSSYNIAGKVFTGKEQKLDLTLNSASGDISTLLSLLPSHDAAWIKKYQNNGKVYFDAKINGNYGKAGSPAISVNFGFESTDINNPTGGQTIKGATLVGKFSNGENRNAESSSILIEQFKGSLNNNPISGSFKLINFNDPYLTISANLQQNLHDLHQFFPVEGIDSLKGSIKLSFDFEGKTKDLKKKEDFDKIKASGEAQIENGALYIKSFQKSAKNISADLIFNNTDISINNLSFNTANSDVTVNGIMKNVLRKLIIGKGNILVEGSLSSSKLKYEDFILPLPSKEGKSSDNSSLLLSLDCQVENLFLADLHAQKLSGQLQYNDSLLVLNNGKMKISGGEVNGNVVMEVKLPHRARHINLSNTFSGIAIENLLESFHDFEQEFITHKILSGKVSGKSSVFFIMNPDGTVLHESILANIDVEIADGRLRDFKPMMSLSRFAEESSLKDVRFSQLTNQVLIKNSVVTIPTMHIVSNVCDIELSGTHTFDNAFAYRLKVPLKNLSKKKQAEAAATGSIENPGLLGNANIFILIEGKGDDFEVKYDKGSVRKKIQADIQKEKQELKDAFNNKVPEVKNSQVNQEEFFEFE
jgi:hypothetical protein